MEIIGFLFLIGVSLYVSVAWFLYAANTLGEYNIGGVPNTLKQKALCLVLGGAVGYLWYVVFINAPFELVIK